MWAEFRAWHAPLWWAPWTQVGCPPMGSRPWDDGSQNHARYETCVESVLTCREEDSEQGVWQVSVWAHLVRPRPTRRVRPVSPLRTGREDSPYSSVSSSSPPCCTQHQRETVNICRRMTQRVCVCGTLIGLTAKNSSSSTILWWNTGAMIRGKK